MKRKLTWIFGLFVFLPLILAGCGESTVEKVDDGEEVSGEEEQKDGQSSEEKDEGTKTEVFAVGDTVQFDDLNITLTGARVVKDDFLEPEYDKYVAIELEIENTSDESATISTMLNMSLMTADGYTMNQAMVSGKGSLDGEVGPGRKLKGEIVFDVENSDYYEFIFEDPFTTGQAIWKIEAGQIQE